MIHYSDKYSDDMYEYRHVILPKQLFKMKIIPESYWNADQSALRLLSEKEWRNIGITQSLGWEHYEIHAPEPHILLFRRPKDFVPPTQPALRRAKDAGRRKHYKIIVPTDVRILYPSSLSQIILPPVFLVMQYQFTMYH
ncbi:CKS-domain-containing protein [Guyanagaster necrorhizus]|uniref:Cyclin-dependent kinases regulatory subunit n=1 Tax=Guyanagaster necrorhizus TaxID=856835 RepID=A0A9P7VX42_9AGAR|nr:CKS-domain-containing protein [Guyanagaster necrorhizus MCA 3950]KAG7448167.1 CKS-domain-containing protein [Guyanagaster necrorhizus MCA 3950]